MGASTEMLHNLIGKIMGQRKNTNQMERRVPRQDPKERRLQECKNCRGILPLSVPGKVLNRVILKRQWWMPDSETTRMLQKR